MNILVWCSLVKTSGGSERVAASLASGLAQRGNRVLLVGPYDDAPADLKRRIHPDVAVSTYLSPGGLLGLARSRALLRSFIHTHHIDLISAHGSILSMLSVPVPVVWTEHSVRNLRRRMWRSARAPFWWAVRSRLLSRQWGVVGVSKYILDDLRRQMRLPSNCGAVIYNGIPDAEELTGLAPPRLSRPIQLGCIGRLDAEKRPEDIFELSQRVQAAGVPCEWHFFGEGELKPKVLARARAEGNGRIHVHGYVDSISQAFSRTDGLVLPSRMEGLPTVVLEAKIARRLIFAWNVGGVKEAAAEDSVLVTPPFDLERFAAAMIEALRTPHLPSPYAGDCDFDTMVSRYLTVFDKILKAKSVSPISAESGQPEQPPFQSTLDLAGSEPKRTRLLDAMRTGKSGSTLLAPVRKSSKEKEEV